MSLKDFAFDKIDRSKGVTLGKVDKTPSPKAPVARVHCSTRRGCSAYSR